ncbi:MAG: uracil-DNA glycosylase [Candidatus Eremiobacteraeota bacterium]|nr:uracil-DNA glycosylase [Candidatus Eremiobacteraeota bacterium]
MSLALRAARERALERQATIAAACRKCQIGYTRRNNVFGEGDPCARLLVVGEGPGETEDRLGRPFVGRAGALLDQMLAAIDLPREDVFICNTVKCRPTLEENGKLKNRAPEPEEMANCRQYLDAQIEIIDPKVILALGAPAAKSFLGSKFLITKQRGSWFEGPRGIALMVTFHPAYVLRQTGNTMIGVKRDVWHDLKLVRAKLAETRTPDEQPEQAALFEE